MEWASAFEPWSTRELTGIPDSVRLNLHVAVEMTTGWVRKVAGDGDAPVCTHLGGVLRRNDAEDSWDCPLHGSRFDLDGEVLEGPGHLRAATLIAPRVVMPSVRSSAR